MNPFDDARLDATLQEFLRARAADTVGVRDAATIVAAIALPVPDHGRIGDRAWVGRLVWVAIAAALTLLAASAILLSGRPTAVEERTAPSPQTATRAAAGDGPTLAWSRIDVEGVTRAARFGDRFYLGGRLSDLLTSDDGVSWREVDNQDPASDYGRILSWSYPFASWQGDVVQWDPDPSDPVVRVVQPPSTIVESRGLDRHDNDVMDFVDAAGIGPAGIVAATHTQFDYDGFVRRVLGQDWVDHMSTYGSREEDGAIVVGTDDGRFAEFALADLGLTRTDVEHSSHGWHTVDGQSWTAIPHFPGTAPAGEGSTTIEHIVGTADGFLLQDDAGTMWHSPDGFTWSALGAALDLDTDGSSSGTLLRWNQGVIATDGEMRFDLWTAAGRSALLMASDLPKRDVRWQSEGAGPLGVVVVDQDRAEVLFSPDGSSWSITPMPPDMARFAPDSYADHAASVAVGSDAVVVVLWDDAEGSSVWRGTVAP